MPTGLDLTYYFVGKGGPPSLDPESADIIRNMVHMDHLVGTLLKEKYGNTGRTDPYIAESWNSSADGLVWDFHLKTGLSCEDGTPIDAEGFRQSFNRILKLYAKRDDLAAFSRLKGWKEIQTSNRPLEGIRAPAKDHLQFLFDSHPDGFLEFLTMPFYGFYCSANFENGHWKDPKRIVSSGPYKLESGSVTDRGLTLIKRDDFSLISNDAPKKIQIRAIDAKEALQVPKERSIFYYRQNDAGARPEGLTVFQGAPIFLTALALSPHRKTAFDKIENRKLFRAAVRSVMKDIPLPTVGAAAIHPGPAFYFSDENEGDLESAEHAKANAWKPSVPLKILRLSYSSPDQAQYLEQIVTRALDQLRWPYEMIDPDFKDPDFVKKRNTNREYDIRLAGVDIGASAENWVVGMMFCSQIAISFPDPSGNVCQFVKSHEGRSGHYSDKEYLKQFEKLVADDAAVIPLYHTGSYWLVSPDIDFEKVLAPTLVVPRFDKLRFK
jgi:ABC-type oligopeptide transport system substrate-binding subunit